MENAAQALLIAGGIFIAILTISLLVYMFNNLSTIGNAREQKKESEELASWNAQWEAYNRTRLYGADVLTVINKAKQNNIDYKNSANFKVTIKVDKTIYSETTSKQFATTKEEKRKIYKCTKIEYNSMGRVSLMVFESVI